MFGVIEMLEKFALIPRSEIVGMRAPFLQGGGDEMFQFLQNKNMLYDCSAPSQLFGMQNLDFGRWPHSLDYYTDTDCQIEPCPNCAYPGIWTQPMLDFEDGRHGGPGPTGGYPCSMTDTCQ